MTIKRIAIVMSVLLLCIGKLSAQWATCYQPLSASKVLDTASYEVLYQVQMRWGKRIITDTISLLIGKKYTQTYNPRLKRMRLQKDSLFNLNQDAPSVSIAVLSLAHLWNIRNLPRSLTGSHPLETLLYSPTLALKHKWVSGGETIEPSLQWIFHSRSDRGSLEGYRD